MAFRVVANSEDMQLQAAASGKSACMLCVVYNLHPRQDADEVSHVLLLSCLTLHDIAIRSVQTSKPFRSPGPTRQSNPDHNRRVPRRPAAAFVCHSIDPCAHDGLVSCTQGIAWPGCLQTCRLPQMACNSRRLRPRAWLHRRHRRCLAGWRARSRQNSIGSCSSKRWNMRSAYRRG